MRPERSQTRLLVLNCAVMVQHGFILLINGPLVPSLMSTFAIGESTIGFLFAMGSIGFILGPLIAGTIIDRVGIGSAFIIGLTIELLFFALFGFSQIFVGIVVASFMGRLGTSFIETGVNVLPTLTTGRGSAHARMNLIHAFFSVGAFIGPILIGIYIDAFDRWRPILFFAMVPTALVLLWVIVARIPRNPHGVVEKKHLFHDILAAIRTRTTMLGALSLMLYVGAEVGISTWLVLYLQREFGLNTAMAASGLSVLWIGILIGRYMNSLAGNRFSARSLVVVPSFGGCAGVVIFVLVGNIVAAYLLIGWIGLCLSGVFPNIMADLNNRSPERAGTTTAVMTIGSAVGAGLFQAVVGVVAATVSLRAGFLILGALQALVAGTFLLIPQPESSR